MDELFPQPTVKRGKIKRRLQYLSHPNSTPSHLVLLSPKRLKDCTKGLQGEKAPPVGTSTPAAWGQGVVWGEEEGEVV